MASTISPHNRDWLTCLGVFLACLANYIWTLAPSVSWGDSGEFIAAGYRLGICHPTGYPLYVLLAKIITFLPLGSIALRINLLSALCGAGACALTCAAVLRLSRFYFPNMESMPRVSAGIAAGLGLAFTQVLWSQSVIAEVYALHGFLIAAWVYFLIRWALVQRLGDLLAGLLLFALGLANHVTLILAVPALLGFFILGLFGSSVRRKEYAWCILPFVIGLSLYLFLPLRSMQDPPIDWGDPETLDQLLWVLRGGQFSILDALAPDNIVLETTIRTPFDFVHRLVRDYGLLLFLAAAGLAPLWSRKRGWALGGALMTILINAWWVTRYRRPDNDNYLLPSYVLIALFVGLGLLYLADVLARTLRDGKAAVGFLILALAALPFARYMQSLNVCNQAGNRACAEYGRSVLEILPPQAVLLLYGDESQVFWYTKYVEGLGKDVALVGLNFIPSSKWYQSDLDRQGIPVKAGIRIFQSVQEMHYFYAQHVVKPILDTRPVFLSYNDLTLPGYRLKEIKRLFIPPESAPAYFQRSLPAGGIWKVEPENGSG